MTSLLHISCCINITFSKYVRGGSELNSVLKSTSASELSSCNENMASIRRKSVLVFSSFDMTSTVNRYGILVSSSLGSTIRHLGGGEKKYFLMSNSKSQ